MIKLFFSSINLGGPDGDDLVDFEKKTVQMMNVSYVDFDKTRPNLSLKQNGDGSHQSPKTTVRNPIKKTITPQKPTSKNGNSDTSMDNKTKKRQSKLLEADIKHSKTSTKSIKKHKKNSS